MSSLKARKENLRAKHSPEDDWLCRLKRAKQFYDHGQLGEGLHTSKAATAAPCSARLQNMKKKREKQLLFCKDATGYPGQRLVDRPSFVNVKGQIKKTISETQYSHTEVHIRDIGFLFSSPLTPILAAYNLKKKHLNTEANCLLCYRPPK